MKKFNKIVSKLAVLTLVAALVACSSTSKKDSTTKSEVSVDSIREKFETESKKVESFKSEMSYVIDMEVSQGGQKAGVLMDISANIQTDMKNKIMKNDMSMDMEIAGQKQTVDLVSYEVEENGKGVMYTNALNEWTTEAGQDDPFSHKTIFNEYTSTWNADTKYLGTGEVQGKKTYKVSVMMSGTEFKDAMNQMTSGNDTMSALFEGVDLDKMGKVERIIEFYQDSGLIAAVESDVASFLKDLYKETLSSSSIEGEIKVNKAFIRVEITSYNDVKGLELPAEAKK